MDAIVTLCTEMEEMQLLSRPGISVVDIRETLENISLEGLR